MRLGINRAAKEGESCVGLFIRESTGDDGRKGSKRKRKRKKKSTRKRGERRKKVGPCGNGRVERLCLGRCGKNLFRREGRGAFLPCSFFWGIFFFLAD